MNVVVGVWSCLWGCLGLGLDVQVCDGVFDCIIVQAAIDGDRAWPLMGEVVGSDRWRGLGTAAVVQWYWGILW